MINQDELIERFRSTRQQSVRLCAPLAIEDYGVQPMDDASPPKWHLAHTTWFFETFILRQYLADYQPFNPQFEYLFNSYYNGVGQPFPRTDRGFLSRPTVEEVKAYRTQIDDGVGALLEKLSDDETIASLVVLGINHEQQHQELLVTDLKYNFGHNPLTPCYRAEELVPAAESEPARFVEFAGGILPVGLEPANSAFKFDNECPRHEVLIHPFRLASRLVTNGEFLEFVQDGGYQSSHLWLAEGWQVVQQNQWQHPLYWRCVDGEWLEYRLDGLHALDLNAPVVHLSGHESFAYATWRDARLPTEFEWELAAEDVAVPGASEGAWLEAERFHPAALKANGGLEQMYGCAWQWTQSSYAPYPGFKPLDGTLGEYNGKFMSSQWVLRGGSTASPEGHVRRTYRNFFYPPDRWQFSGLRLAQDA